LRVPPRSPPVRLIISCVVLGIAALSSAADARTGLGAARAAARTGLRAASARSPRPTGDARIATSCLTPAVRTRLDVATGGAKYRYTYEADGAAARVALARVQDDTLLRGDLEAGRVGPARAEADTLLIDHVVRIAITLRGGGEINVNPSSFAVAGGRGDVLGAGGRLLGRAEVSIQDILGYVKLGHRFTGAELRVTGRTGHLVSSLPAADGVSLPASGCVTLAGRRYATRTFRETGFAGEPLSVAVLVRA